MLAAVQRKQTLAHGVVKCTCKCNDLLFQLRVARLMESKKVSRRDSQHVFEHPTLKPGCVLHTWSHKHRPAPEQIFHEKSNGLKCVEHFFYIFAEFWCSVSAADKISFPWPLQAWKKFWSIASIAMYVSVYTLLFGSIRSHSIQICIHWASLLITVWLQNPLAHTRSDTNTSGPSLCIPLQADERKRGGNMWPTLLDTVCMCYVWVL